MSNVRTITLLQIALILLTVSVVFNVLFLAWALKKTRYFSPSTSVVHKQFNFHVVAPGFWRSAMLNKESVKRMRAHGLKTIINLRMKGKSSDWEKELAEHYEINYYHFPMDAHIKQESQVLEDILGILENPAKQPVLVHCGAGKDRTSLISALYRLKFSDWRLEDIHKEMLMYGYDEGSFPLIFETVKEWNEKRMPAGAT